MNLPSVINNITGRPAITIWSLGSDKLSSKFTLWFQNMLPSLLLLSTLTVGLTVIVKFSNATVSVIYYAVYYSY